MPNNQSNFYSANIPGEARLSGTKKDTSLLFSWIYSLCHASNAMKLSKRERERELKAAKIGGGEHF